MAALIALYLTSTPIFAQSCATRDPKPGSTHYSSTVHCPFGDIIIEGRRNSETYEECNLVPAASEKVFVREKHGTLVQLPNAGTIFLRTLNADVGHSIKGLQASMIRDDLSFRTWMASNVQCLGTNKATIDFWGGGNCTLCERRIAYEFSQEGKPLNAGLESQTDLEKN
jgi:hypothetical protein